MDSPLHELIALRVLDPLSSTHRPIIELRYWYGLDG
jgi:hypothetical protein